MTTVSDSSQKLAFTVALTCISRICLAWDRLLGRLERDGGANDCDALVSRLGIESGNNLLDAFLVKPASGPARNAVLLCLGIGETVQGWLGAQRLLAANDIASLSFDYSGYGRSSGSIHANQCEQDAISAFLYLQRLMPSLPISILGFSLGSGIAAALLHRVPIHRLVLCAVFTSFKAAAFSVGLPETLAFFVPDIWRTEEALKACAIPVLIVHGDCDQLFPIEMALALKSACRSQAELVIVPRLSHNEPYHSPHPSYWGQIVAQFLLRTEAEGGSYSSEELFRQEKLSAS